MTPWTEIAAVVALGVGANTENLPVGFACGLRKLRIGLARNLLIAGVTTTATLVPLAAGQGLRGYVPESVTEIGSGLLLIGLGLSNMWLERSGTRGEIERVERLQARAGYIGLHETLALAGALSINNIGLGFAGGVAGLDYPPVALSVGCLSVLLLWLGEWFSLRLPRPIAKTLDRLQLDGNLLLVVIGAVMMLGF